MSEKTLTDNNQEQKVFQSFIEELMKYGTTAHRKQWRRYEVAVMAVARKLADWLGGEPQAYLPMFLPWKPNTEIIIRNMDAHNNYIVIPVFLIPDYGATHDRYYNENCMPGTSVPTAIVYMLATDDGWDARVVHFRRWGGKKNDIQADWDFDQEVSYETFEQTIYNCEEENRERLRECLEELETTKFQAKASEG